MNSNHDSPQISGIPPSNPETSTNNVELSNVEPSLKILEQSGSSNENQTLNITCFNDPTHNEPQESNNSCIADIGNDLDSTIAVEQQQSEILNPDLDDISSTVEEHQAELRNAIIPRRDGTNPIPYNNVITITRPHPEMSIDITPPYFPPRVIQGPPPLEGAPPSYSAVMRIGPIDSNRERPQIRIQPSPPFIAPIPPPPYTEVEGYYVNRSTLIPPGIYREDEMVWGPEPLSVICPRCANIVITSTRCQRSNLTHYSALALCLCGCWPCCLVPYCIDSCKNTYHHCPSCRQFLGVYRPW